MSTFSTLSVSVGVASAITADRFGSTLTTRCTSMRFSFPRIERGFHPGVRRLNESESAHRERLPSLGRPPPGTRVPRTRRRYRGRTQGEVHQARLRHRRRRSPPRSMRRRMNSVTLDERSGEIQAVRCGTIRAEIGNIRERVIRMV